MKTLDLLIQYANLYKVDVKFEDTSLYTTDIVAFFSRKEKLIVLSDKLDRESYKTCYILSHEVGHMLDTSYSTDNFYLHKIDSAYSTMNTCVAFGIRTPKEVKNFIISCERSAFNRGDQLLKMLNIQIPKANMKQWRRDALSAYRDMMKGDVKW